MMTYLLIFITQAFGGEIARDFQLKYLTSLNTLKVEKTIQTARPQKEIYFQNKNIINAKDLIKTKAYCTLENVRDKAEIIYLKKGLTFTFENEEFVRSDDYISLRIWENHWFWGKNNGDVQFISCNGNPDFLNNDLNVILTYKDFKNIVGSYLTIH